MFSVNQSKGETDLKISPNILIQNVKVVRLRIQRMNTSEAKLPVKADVEKLQQTKRTYRSILDSIRRLENAAKGKNSYRDVFQMETIAVRNRLKDLCERMMFLNPENYGRKAEELLWRKVFYDVIQLIKQNRKHVRGGSSLECAYRTHLSSAVGYYHHLLNKVQIEFNINVDGVVDWIHVTDSQTHTDKKENKKPVDPKAVEWAKNCCHHCLVYLGDLARYQQDQDGYRSTVLSQRYYHQALLWNADIGMPHNQLGTLSGNRHQSCDAAYHYMRCLMTFSPFDGAHANLQRLLEKNRRRYKELPQSDLRDLPPDLQRPKDIKKLLIEFMYLLDILQPDSTASTAEISEVCQRVLHDFNLCMYYTHSNGDQPIMPSIRGAEDDKEQFIPDDLVFKIVVMCLITIYRLQETGSEQVSASIAFTLALFSHVLNHLNSRIQSSLYDMEHPLAIIDSNDKDDSVLLCSSGHESEEDDQLTPQSTGTITPGNSQDVTYGNNSLKNRKKPQTKRVRAIHKLRRQRRGLEDDLDLSEGEEDLGSSQSDYSDSDSELSADDVLVSDSDSEDESLMESQELTPGFASRTHLLSDNHYQEPSKEDISNNVSLTNNLKDMSNQLFSQNPSASFLRRNIRLAPTFDAYVLDAKAQGESKTSEVAIEDGDRGEPTKVITEDPEDDEDDDKDTDSVIDRMERKTETLKQLVSVLSEQGLVLSVKVFADWLIANPYIIDTCAQSSQSLWSRLSVFLNHLPEETQINNEDICESCEAISIVNSAIQYNDWHQTVPLTEDYALYKLPSLQQAHQHLEYNHSESAMLSKKDEALVRGTFLRQFGYHLANLTSSVLVYDQEKCLFLVSSQVTLNPDKPPAEDEKASLATWAETQMKMAEEETRRNQLMKDMAQLRLQSEVKQLEGSLEPKNQSNLSPYLVPDTRVLTHHLNIIKQFAACARFIIIIPRVAIDMLDYIKKSTQGARDAIKFLEREFHKGNRYLRAQKENETVKIHHDRKKIKGEEREVWCFYHTLDCCRYFANQSSDYDPKGMVTILTNHKSEDTATLSVRMRAAINAANADGINVMYAPDFYNKWKCQG